MSKDLLTKVFPLTLGEQTFNLRFTMEAEYLIGSPVAGFSINDLRDENRSYAALVAWVWAMMSDADRERYVKPQKLAPLIQSEEEIKAAMAAVFKAYLSGTKDDPKNGNG